LISLRLYWKLHRIRGIDNEICTTVSIDTDKETSNSHEHVRANFSRVDDKKLGASIEEVEKELKLNG